MRLLIHAKQNLKMPQFKVDEPLSIQSNNDPLLKK